MKIESQSIKIDLSTQICLNWCTNYIPEYNWKIYDDDEGGGGGGGDENGFGSDFS